MTSRAEQHPDVQVTLSMLRTVLADAAALAPASPQKASRPTGAAALRAIARAQRKSPDALHHRALDFYRALITLSRNGDGKATHKAALTLAALAQRAAAEGYDAVDTHLIKRVLTPLLHSLPLETLCELARLNDRHDETGEKILRDAGRLLGMHKQRDTSKAEHAVKEYKVASVLLGVVAELSREHAHAISWDRQVAIALEAARNGQHQQLDAALREMWRGDFLAGEMDRPRVQRLAGTFERLGVNQQYALATMLGITDQADATTHAFDDFQARYLAEFERDEAVHGQMRRFIDHLRAAGRATMQGGANARPGARRGGTGADASGEHGGASVPSASPPAFPAAIKPDSSIRASISRFTRRLSHRVRTTFGMQLPTRDAARTQIKQAVQTLIEGDRLTAQQLDALQSANQRLNGKLGKVVGVSVQRMLIQNHLSKLDPEQLAQLAFNLATARGSLPSSRGKDETLEKFYGALQDRLEREAGVRQGAAALAQVAAALPQTRYPGQLLDALDVLADAQRHALDHQSELDYYDEALARLDKETRAALQKRLNGRDAIRHYMRGIDDMIGYAPAWSQYRRSQLHILSRAALGQTRGRIND
ncbi:MAG TPA: hypothetical protein VL522_23835 [Bordetella sp.]|nr:hypothetical protein [Bordetella sp.]